MESKETTSGQQNPQLTLRYTDEESILTFSSSPPPPPFEHEIQTIFNKIFLAENSVALLLGEYQKLMVEGSDKYETVHRLYSLAQQQFEFSQEGINSAKTSLAAIFNHTSFQSEELIAVMGRLQNTERRVVTFKESLMQTLFTRLEELSGIEKTKIEAGQRSPLQFTTDQEETDDFSEGSGSDFVFDSDLDSDSSDSVTPLNSPAISMTRVTAITSPLKTGALFECILCSKEYSSKRSLQKHIGSYHNNITHICNMCDRKFTRKFHLTTHIDSIHRRITHSCDMCDKKFTQKSTLTRHIDNIHGRITHSCDMCDKKFTDKSSLNRHTDSIHRRITHSCDMCNKKFTQKFHLTTHIDSIHRRITHSCDMCDKKFTLKSNFTRHIKKSHQKNTYDCDFCDKKFLTEATLRRHLTKTHEE